LKFKEGKPGRFDEIQNFHSYNGQDEDHHDAYDLPGGSGSDLKPSDLSCFNNVVGARDAIDKCTVLARFWREGKKWDEGVKKFLDTEFFMISSNATPSNVQVDESIR
jgi:hypothetical protein